MFQPAIKNIKDNIEKLPLHRNLTIFSLKGCSVSSVEAWNTFSAFLSHAKNKQKTI